LPLRVQLAREIRGKYLKLMVVRFSGDDSDLMRMAKLHLAFFLIA